MSASAVKKDGQVILKASALRVISLVLLDSTEGRFSLSGRRTFVRLDFHSLWV